MSRVARRAVRQASSATAYLYSADGWPLGECQMRDVSSTGAKLMHEIEDEMPERFLLSFSRDGKVRRHCQVVWKKEKEIGVRFVKD
jgi:PilZ domain